MWGMKMFGNVYYGTYRRTGFLVGGIILLLITAYMLGWMATSEKYGFLTIPLVLGLIGTFLIIKYPTIGFSLMFFLIPLGPVSRIEGLGRSVQFLLGVLLLGIYAGKVLILHEKIKFDRISLLGCMFAAWAIISSVWSYKPEVALFQAIFRLSQMIALYILVLNYCRNERQLDIITLSFIAGGIVAALLTIMKKTTYGGSDRLTLDEEFNINVFSRLLGFSIILIFYYMYKMKSKLVRLVFIFGIMAMTYVIIGGQTRTVWVAFPASFMITAVLLHRSSKIVNYSIKIIGIVIVSFAFAYFSGIISESVTERFESLRYIFSDNPEAEATGRFRIWKVGLAMLKDTMPLGVGFQNYKLVYKQYRPETNPSDFSWAASRARGAHNTYLAILAELGVVGFVLMVFILAYVGKSIILITDPISRFIYMWLFTFFLIGIFTGVYHVAPWFWFILFLISSQGRLKRRLPQPVFSR
jgi:O-antigen ligase